MEGRSGIEWENIGASGKAAFPWTTEDDMRIGGVAWIPSPEIVDSIIETNEAKTKLYKVMTQYYDKLLDELNTGNRPTVSAADSARDRARALAGDILD